jgi:hypothetical protein
MSNGPSNYNYYSNKTQNKGSENESSTNFGLYGGRIGGQQQPRTAPAVGSGGGIGSSGMVGGGGSSSSEDWFNPSAAAGHTTRTSSNVGVGGIYGSHQFATGGSSFPGQQLQDPFGYSTMSSSNTVGPYRTTQMGLSSSVAPGSTGSSFSQIPNTMDLSGPMGADHHHRPLTSSTSRSSMLQTHELSFENEPPLMEELGINIPQIIQKTKAVIFPVGTTSSIDSHLMDDDDLAGPLVYAMLLGGELLLSAKISFGYIYGFGLFGCFAMTLIINLMSPKADGVSLWRVTSILGYCLLPVNFLAALNCILFLKYRGLLGLVLAAVSVLWCTVASTRLFERSCDMRNQRYLIAYPIAMLYTSFVMITIF